MDLGAQWDPPKLYWSALSLLHAQNTSIRYEEAKGEVRRLLTAAVKRRLVADRASEKYVYLSGAVDSATRCGIVSSLGHPLTSLTIGFGDHRLSKEDAETAQHYSLQHETVNFTSEDAAMKAIYHTEINLANPHSRQILSLRVCP